MQHKKLHEQERRNRETAAAGEELSPEEAAYFAKLKLDAGSPPRSEDAQAETRSHLKPHSRSTLQLQYITSQAQEKKEESVQAPAKKSRTRWQFGIRSRNLPHEAMHCVYKALASQNAKWEVPVPSAMSLSHPPSTYPVHVHGATHVNEAMPRRGSDSPERGRQTPVDNRGGQEDYMYNFSFDGNKNEKRPNVSSPIYNNRPEEDDRNIDPHVTPEGYIPKDPWCIKVRWRKDGMYPAGKQSGSAASSHLDLNSENRDRRASLIGSLSSAATSTTSVGTSIGTDATTGADGACYVYMDVQLYTLEPGNDKQTGTYLVDFKCAGYESIVEQAVNDTEKLLLGEKIQVGSGHRSRGDKDVTSPQPFLDLTNKLVIHLAGGGGER